MSKIKVKNRKTGVESSMTTEQWEKTKNNPLFEGTFVEVKSEVPPEVLKIQEAKANIPSPPKAKAEKAEKQVSEKSENKS
jgi:hypothetical protein